MELKPEIPVPVLFVPSGLTKVNYDSRNLPSWTKYCLEAPFVTAAARETLAHTKLRPLQQSI